METFEELLAAARALLAGHEHINELWEANSQVNEALKQRPKEASAWLLKSQLLSSLEDDLAALAAAEMALGLAPEQPEARYVRAAVLADLERHEEALLDIQQAFELLAQGGDELLLEDLYYERGMMLDALGREEDAVAAFEDGLRRFPESELLRTGIEPLRRERLRTRFRVIDGGVG